VAQRGEAAQAFDLALLLGVSQAKGAVFIFAATDKETPMGKGDKKTFRGKVFRGSHGKSRPRKPKKKPAPVRR
jgi:ribosomal small subunit protein bTHX